MSSIERAVKAKAFPKTFWPSCDFRRNSLPALFLHRTHVRLMLSRNAKMKRETNLGLRETPSRRTKPIKIFRKRQNEAGNRSNSPKSHFLRRETGKILRKVIFRGGKRGKMLRKTASCGGKASKSFGDRFRATGKGAYGIRPQDVSNGNDFVHPYKWNRNRLPQCPPLLSPLRCIWAPTASGAFVLNGIEQCPRKRFVVFLWHLSFGRM